VLTRAQSPRQAAQSAWAALVDKGITSFTDTSGRQWALSTYVEMAVRTAASRAALQAQIDGFTLAGQRLVRVNDRPGECPRCRRYESKVLALWGGIGPANIPRARGHGTAQVEVFATLAEARADGLFHPGCRHGVSPWIAGVSRIRKATADPEGHAARERQRYIERQLRKWRQRQAAALLDEARDKAAARVAAWDAEMARHIAATRLTRLRHREMPGAGHEATDRQWDRADLPVR
jgi:hypothetical protein